MKQEFLKKIMIMSSCFSILCFLAAPSSFAGGNMQEVLSVEIAELHEKLHWISDNERLDYPEDKAFLYKKINELTNVLNTISDNERIYPEEKAYASFQVKKLTDALNTIAAKERIYPGEKVYVSYKFDKLTQVLGVVIDDNERLDYLSKISLDKDNQTLAQVLGVIIDCNERDISFLFARDLSQVLSVGISDNDQYMEDDDVLKAQELTQFLGFLLSKNDRGMDYQIEELIDVFGWISDNERLDYPEKIVWQNKIQALTQVLGVIISDNERDIH